MDIRNFFAKKASSNSNATGTTKSRKKVDDVSAAKRKKKEDVAKNENTKKPNKSPKKPVVTIDDSSDENVTSERPKSSKHFAKTKKAISNDDSITADGEAADRDALEVSNDKKRKADKEKAQDISPKAFFAMGKAPSKKQKEEEKPEEEKSFQEELPPRRNSPRKAKSDAKKRIREEDSHPEVTDEEYQMMSSGNDDEVLEQDDKPKARQSVKPSPKALPKISSPQRSSPTKASPPKRARITPPKPETPNKAVPLEPTLELESFDIDDVQVPEMLMGLTFVFTGILDNLHRDSAVDLIKSLGGRVTGNVSGKTNYLVVGQELEDGRHYSEGKKYRTAQEKGITIVMGEKKLYGLCHLFHERAKQNLEGLTPAKPPTKPSPAAKAAVAPLSNPYAKKVASISNPYAKKAAPAANPYAKASNPYASAANPYAKTTKSSEDVKPAAKEPDSLNRLWVDRHAPEHTREILGNKDNINKLKNCKCLPTSRQLKATIDCYVLTSVVAIQGFLLGSAHSTTQRLLEKHFQTQKGPGRQPSCQGLQVLVVSMNMRLSFRCFDHSLFLTESFSIQETTTATLVAKEAGRDLLELNASDARSKKALQNNLGDVTGSQTLNFGPVGSKPKKASAKKLRCIIMDEVDGMGAGDRSGMAELIQMIKKSKVPIICICNDRQSPKMKSLLPYCMDLRFKRPTKSVMATRAVRIAEMEGLQVERNAAEAIAESCGNDVRQVLNCLQMWSQKQDDGAVTYKGLKERERSINKDEILRVSLFDAAKTIMEGRRNLSGADIKTERDSFFRRSDAFFVDYSLVGLLVQQNYPKVMNGQFHATKRTNDPMAEQEFLERMHQATASMSDFAVVEHEIRTGDQNWSLLPTCGMLAVQTGYHAGGETGGALPGFPEFTAWMGKNSSKGKKMRLLNELHFHMNFKISGDSQQLRQSYLPILRERFLGLFKSEEEGSTTQAIALMDEYGLSRDDIMEKLDEFKMDKNGGSFADLDSKHKAAITREYNQGTHKSQALVGEQGRASKKKSSVKRERDPGDLDAIDEDNVEEESDEEDAEEELKKLQEKFKKKGRKSGGGKKGSKSKKKK